VYGLAEYRLSSHNLVVFFVPDDLTIEDDVDVDGLIPFRFRILETFLSLLRDRINRSVLSIAVSTENTSSLCSCGLSESKR